MSCANCRDIEEIDGVPPDCGSCPVTPLSFEGARVLEMRSMLLTIGGLCGPEGVLRIFGAGEEDLRLLAAVEEEMKKLSDKKNGV